MFKRGTKTDKSYNSEDIIYIIRAINTNNFKVGKSNKSSLEKRLQAIKTGCPYPCEIYATFPGSYELETKIHSELSPFRTNGEWFCIDDNSILQKVIAKFQTKITKVSKSSSSDENIKTSNLQLTEDILNKQTISALSDCIRIKNLQIKECETKLYLESSINFNIQRLYNKEFTQLGPVEKSIYVYLICRLYEVRKLKKEKNLNEISIGNRQIARDVSCSGGTVSKSISKLQECGLLKMSRAHKGSRATYCICDFYSELGEKNDTDSTNV